MRPVLGFQPDLDVMNALMSSACIRSSAITPLDRKKSRNTAIHAFALAVDMRR